MHAAELRDAARVLAAAGVNDCEVARRLGVPRTTVRDWRSRARDAEVCPRCWRTTKPVRFGGGDYAELLGLYLGDGHISPFSRTERLRLHLDARYPNIVDEAEVLLQRCFPANRVGRSSRHDGSMVVLCVYHGHLHCLLPQAGPGKKHLRPMVLEPWQAALVEAEPWRFLRGCIRSDGCVFVNRTGRYEYLSYEFSNLSRDIVDLFMATCEGLGLRPRRYRRYVRLYRRDDVARLVAEVGTKF
jgi:Homeodomain-like domain-containing protein